MDSQQNSRFKPVDLLNVSEISDSSKARNFFITGGSFEPNNGTRSKHVGRAEAFKKILQSSKRDKRDGKKTQH